MDLSDLKWCNESGITSSMLFESEPLPQLQSLRKRLVLKLLKVKKLKGLTWCGYAQWIEKMYVNPEFSVNALPILAVEQNIISWQRMCIEVVGMI